jgi:hypothetical protein
MIPVIILLSSCIANKEKSKVVIMQNPQTMDFQDCKVADWGSEEAFKNNEECVKTYQSQGYIIWGER